MLDIVASGSDAGGARSRSNASRPSVMALHAEDAAVLIDSFSLIFQRRALEQKADCLNDSDSLSVAP